MKIHKLFSCAAVAAVASLMACSGGNEGAFADVKWDATSLIINGKRVVPVMGEVHYSRIPESEWRYEIEKMKDGGVDIIATYVFWNHHEEKEGVFRWDGERNLRKFIETCKELNMPVVLRVGPFCHGEVRCGGIPDWWFEKGRRARSEDSVFLDCTRRLYTEIFKQVEGLQCKDGGPIIAAQFDNEYRGHGSYLMALKKMALEIGFDLPMYTRTGWPELKTPVPYGEMVPLYGDYADGFWDRSLREGAGNYYKAFNFKQFRSSTAIATEQLGEQKQQDNEQGYPYFTCELGGGMAAAYHRRPYLEAIDAYSMAVVKLGSGSNLLGYYMYHGGTNPEGETVVLNERQASPATNYNDMPCVTYDFQAPLGEFGQPYPQYFMLRKLHIFMHDYAEMLAPMATTIVSNQDLAQGDNSELRWAYRSNDKKQAFVFINNYERFGNLTAKEDVKFDVCGVLFPQQPMTIPAGCVGIMPVNVEGMHYATAQLVSNRDGKIILCPIAGLPIEIGMQNGDIYTDLQPMGLDEPIVNNIYIVDEETAEHLYLRKNYEYIRDDAAVVDCQRVSEPQTPVRTISIGKMKVAEQPTDADFDEHAYVYKIKVTPQMKNDLLSINYVGDCARLYTDDGKLIADNFYYGRTFLYGLWRLPNNDKEQTLTLKILRQQEDAPIYYPSQAERNCSDVVVNSVDLFKRM